jgi:splicing factor 3B subunit 2
LEEEEEVEDEDEEEEENEDAGTEAGTDGMETPMSGMETPSGVASSVPSGLETPEFLELRKDSRRWVFNACFASFCGC